MNIALRRSLWTSSNPIVPGAYIRSTDSKLGYAISNATDGFGHYKLYWRGSVAAGMPAAGNGWTGPMGTNTFLSANNEWFRWYITGDGNGTAWQHAFWNQTPSVSRSQFSYVYGGDGSSNCGWIVLDQDITKGSGKTSQIYSGQTLESLSLIGTTTATINTSVLPTICYGIFGSAGRTDALPATELSQIDSGGCSIPPAGSRFFNFKLEKDGVLTHDCYPVLNNGAPAIYDVVTREYAAETCGGTPEYGIDTSVL